MYMGVVYRPSSSSSQSSSSQKTRSTGPGSYNRGPSQFKTPQQEREEQQNTVRGLYALASLIAIGFMVFPLFGIIGFFPAVGTGIVMIVVVVISYRVAEMAISVSPVLGFWVSAGLVGAMVFVGNAFIHATFPATQPEINIADTAIETNISIVNQIYGTSQYISAAIYPYQIDNRLFFHVYEPSGTRQVEIPQRLFMNFGERLWTNLGGSIHLDLGERLNGQSNELKELISPRENLYASNIMLVADGEVPTLNFQQVFPGQLVLRSVSLDSNTILTHIEKLWNASPLSPTDTAIINGIPSSPSELTQTRLETSEWDQWNGISNAWNNTITENGFSVSGNSAQDALDALQTSANVVVIVAHSDGFNIFFPDGSSLSTDDLSSIQESIIKNEPLVTLFSCETAKVDENLVSFAKKLVDLGAKAVVAPVSLIGARSSSTMLESFLRASNEGSSPMFALQKAVQETKNLSLETWVGLEPEIGGKY
jgi:hypothetical protein